MNNGSHLIAIKMIEFQKETTLRRNYTLSLEHGLFRVSSNSFLEMSSFGEPSKKYRVIVDHKPGLFDFYKTAHVTESENLDEINKVHSKILEEISRFPILYDPRFQNKLNYMGRKSMVNR